ncbi:MAG: TetR/AcrR family transcriptional regulator [Clostridia bacterium]|nr:TetR/AcrR family transcriptional regulator [Clostridia bacterium]
MDTRIEQSKQEIAESLIYLMKKKDFASITNKDITDKAGLSHITIYRHFKTKDEIIKYYLDDITDNFIRTSKILYVPNDFKGYIIKLFTHLENKKDIGILLYKSNMIHYLKDEFDRIFLAKANNRKEEYHYAFISGGLYNLYYYWIKNNCKENSTELANMFNEFYILKGDSN